MLAVFSYSPRSTRGLLEVFSHLPLLSFSVPVCSWPCGLFCTSDSSALASACGWVSLCRAASRPPRHLPPLIRSVAPIPPFALSATYWKLAADNTSQLNHLSSSIKWHNKRLALCSTHNCWTHVPRAPKCCAQECRHTTPPHSRGAIKSSITFQQLDIVRNTSGS